MILKTSARKLETLAVSKGLKTPCQDRVGIEIMQEHRLYCELA